MLFKRNYQVPILKLTGHHRRAVTDILKIGYWDKDSVVGRLGFESKGGIVRYLFLQVVLLVVRIKQHFESLIYN